jgi:hypothetical protein
LLYFFILPAFALWVFTLGALTLAGRYIHRLQPVFPFIWRIFLWSCIAFILAQIPILLLFLLPALGWIAEKPSDIVAILYAGSLIFGPVVVSAIGILGGSAFGVWLALRAKRKDTRQPLRL